MKDRALRKARVHFQRKIKELEEAESAIAEFKAEARGRYGTHVDSDGTVSLSCSCWDSFCGDRDAFAENARITKGHHAYGYIHVKNGLFICIEYNAPGTIFGDAEFIG